MISRRFFQYALAGLDLVLILSIFAFPALPAHSSAPPAPAGEGEPPSQPDLAICSWGYYAGGKDPLVPLYADANGLPPHLLRTGGFYRQAGPLSARGVIDYNGDNRGDIFAMARRPDNLYQWVVWDSVQRFWVDRAYAKTERYRLYLGDFGGDGITDAFTMIYEQSPFDWFVSTSMTGSYTKVNTQSNPVYSIALGDFNGDGKADIFNTTGIPPEYELEQWRYSSAATGKFINLAYAAIDGSDLRFADFNGDGKTDVFAALEQPDGSYQWMVSASGLGSFQNLARTPYSPGAVDFGDFNGDGKADVFAVQVRPDGKADWVYYSAGKGDPVLLRTGRPEMPMLSDFNADGIADLFSVDCAGANRRFTRLPALRRPDLDPLQGFQPRLADLNGDYRPDIVWSTVCRSYIFCEPQQNVVAAALSAGGGRLDPTPLQTLSGSRTWTDISTFTGDVDGDGRDDLIFLRLVDPAFGSASSLYVARSNGDGSFSLSPRGTLGAGLGSYFPAAGDFNGDGRVDLLLSTICLGEQDTFVGGCKSGATNLNYLALNVDGAFVVGPLQALGPGGWSGFVGLVADFTGDGKDDLLFNSAAAAGSYNYLVASTGAGFQLGPLQTFPGFAGGGDYATTGDYNGDGRKDLFWFGRCNAGSCYQVELQARLGLSQPDGTFQVTNLTGLGVMDWADWWVYPADVNGDGRDDLVWTYEHLGFPPASGRKELLVMYAQPGGGFTPRAALEHFPTGMLDYWVLGPYSGKPFVADLTGDGKAEVLWASGREVEVAVNGPLLTYTYLPVVRKK